MNQAVEARLAALGLSSREVVESFVRGSGPGGQKIKISKSIPTVSVPPSDLHR